MSRAYLVAVLLVTSACPSRLVGDDGPTDAGEKPDGGPTRDGGALDSGPTAPMDASTRSDSGTPADAGSPRRRCSFNAQPVADGVSVKAYLTASASISTTCTSEVRLCSDGQLSGSYTFSSCFQHKLNRIAPGPFYSCVLVDDRISCWGSAPSYFDTALATAMNASLDGGVIRPAPIIASGATDVSASYNAFCQISNGALTCGSAQGSNPPVTTTVFASGAKSVVAGFFMSCGVVGDDLKCWRNGSTNLTSLSTTPVTVMTDAAISSYIVTFFDVCALSANGAVKCSTLNSAMNTFNPPVTLIDSGASKISLTSYGTGCALIGSELQCWGNGASALLRIDPGRLFRTGPPGDGLCARHAVIDLSPLRSRASLRIDHRFEVVSLAAHRKSLARAKTQAVYARSVPVLSPRALSGSRASQCASRWGLGGDQELPDHRRPQALTFGL